MSISHALVFCHHEATGAPSFAVFAKGGK